MSEESFIDIYVTRTSPDGECTSKNESLPESLLIGALCIGLDPIRFRALDGMIISVETDNEGHECYYGAVDNSVPELVAKREAEIQAARKKYYQEHPEENPRFLMHPMCRCTLPKDMVDK